MKAIADGLRVALNLKGLPEVTVTLTSRPESDLNDLMNIISQGKELDVEIKQHRKKRSLDANSYAWVLLSKMADKLKTSKDTLYIDMLRQYGQREPQLLSIVADGAEMVYRATQGHCTEVGESELNGKVFKHLAVLRGSSTYDSKEFSAFLDGITYEAKSLGIQTLDEIELERMVKKWGELERNHTTLKI